MHNFLHAVAPRKAVAIQTPLDMEKGNPFDADYYSEKRHNFQLQRGRSLSIVSSGVVFETCYRYLTDVIDRR